MNPLGKQFQLLYQSMMLQCQKIPNGPIILALSGGLDSTVLLHLLSNCLQSKTHPIFPCFIEHGIQTPQNQINIQALQTYCHTLGTSLKVFSIQPGWIQRKAKQTALSIEDLARDERYRRLQLYAKQQVDSDIESKQIRIALAQHADDQVESFMMNLGRGSGIYGLSGMRELQTINTQILLWRPLLQWRRKDIQNWAQKHQVPHWEDPSNFEQNILRNFYRWQVLPQLYRLNPNFSHGIFRCQSYLQLQEDALDTEKQKLLNSMSIQAHQIIWKGRFADLSEILQVELCYILFDHLCRGEKRRKRLPLGFIQELRKQWSQKNAKHEEKDFLFSGHFCNWLIRRQEVIATKMQFQ